MFRGIRLLFFSSFFSCLLVAQGFEYFPGSDYDPTIPRLKDVLGYDFGERITDHRDMLRYLETLAEASAQLRLVPFGESWEGRRLSYLIVSSAANLARLDQIKAGMQRLADPRALDQTEAIHLIEDLPVVVWFAHGIHGNETSSPDAALLTAYHLAASTNDPMVEGVLQKCVVVIDPAQNPDGRDRFIQHFRETRGRLPNPDPQSAEHHEPWPSGRVNHYLFDMNRDWFALTQIESRFRMKAFLEWFPVVFVDLHEMGSDFTYYFPPAAPPTSPFLNPSQGEWLSIYGRNNAEWFDRFRFDYFTREVFNGFFPGYGMSWPMMHGAIGMTYEQASVRGLTVRRNDETTLLFRDAVQRHFIASLSTAEASAKHRLELLRYFYDYRREAVEEGRRGELKEYILPPSRDAIRVSKLAALLQTQGVEIKRADKPFLNEGVRVPEKGPTLAREFPEGTFVVSLAQPAGRLIRTLLDQHVPMDPAFIQEQVRRKRRREPDQVYDVTSWSLPLLYGVDIYASEVASGGQFVALSAPPAQVGRIIGGRAGVAYLVPWDTNAAAQVLSHLIRQKLRVFFSERPFALQEVRFPAGSLIVKVKDNPEDLYERLQQICQHSGVNVYATDTGWVDSGVNLGSGQVHYLKPPRIALAWSEPTLPYSAGWARYVLEQMYQVPVTVVHTRQLLSASLDKYNVLILPSSNTEGGYSDVLKETGARKIRSWVERGGTLVALAGATEWLTREDVGLLASQREFKGGLPAPEVDSQRETQCEKALANPGGELPAPTPGSIVRVQIDTEHWLAFGCGSAHDVIVEGQNIFVPLKEVKGRNVGLFGDEDGLLISGFMWEETKRQLAGKAYLMHQTHGHGHVVAFCQDPNFRAYFDGLNLLFLNPVLFGPSL